MPNNKSFLSKVSLLSSGEYFDPSDDRRVALVTGSTGSFGRYIVLSLYCHGYIVYLAGRNSDKIQKLIRDIKLHSQDFNEDITTKKCFGELHPLILDFLDLKSVDNCANEFLKKELKLNLLINNAGVMGFDSKVTSDDINTQYEINFVSHFLLTIKLLPLLENSSNDDNSSAKIINVSSVASYFSHENIDNVYLKFLIPRPIRIFINYGKSKLDMIRMTKFLSKKYPSIVSVSVHPGVYLRSSLFHKVLNLYFWGSLIKYFFWILLLFFDNTESLGVNNILRLALISCSELKKDNGEFFFKSRKASIYKDVSYEKSLEIYEKTVEKLIQLGFLVSDKEN